MAATQGELGESILLDTPLKDASAAANTAGMVAWACGDNDAATPPVDFCNQCGSGNLSRGSFTPTSKGCCSLQFVSATKTL